jgi:hypothetical protein
VDGEPGGQVEIKLFVKKKLVIRLSRNQETYCHTLHVRIKGTHVNLHNAEKKAMCEGVVLSDTSPERCRGERGRVRGFKRNFTDNFCDIGETGSGGSVGG